VIGINLITLKKLTSIFVSLNLFSFLTCIDAAATTIKHRTSQPPKEFKAHKRFQKARWEPPKLTCVLKQRNQGKINMKNALKYTKKCFGSTGTSKTLWTLAIHQVSRPFYSLSPLKCKPDESLKALRASAWQKSKSGLYLLMG